MNKHWEFSANFLLPAAIRGRAHRITSARYAIEGIPGRKAREHPRIYASARHKVREPVCVHKTRGRARIGTHVRARARAFGIISQTGCNVNNLYELGAAPRRAARLYTHIYFSVILICTLGIFYHRICIRITAGAM